MDVELRSLRRGELQLWRAPLDLSDTVLTKLAEPLSREEWDLAKRLRLESERTRFVVRRAWLRHLLASYLRVDPRDMTFRLGPNGKPYLSEPGSRWLSFSASHSSNLALIAVANRAEVGIDVEEVRLDFPSDIVAERFFSGDEQHKLAALPVDQRTSAFFAMWTLKEAYVKGIGGGLDEIALRLDTTAWITPSRWLGVGAGRVKNGGGWSLGSIAAGPGYAAAVALQAGAIDINTQVRPLCPIGG